MKFFIKTAKKQSKCCNWFESSPERANASCISLAVYQRFG